MFCVICGGRRIEAVETAIGRRFYCLSCFHGWRAPGPQYDYTATAMCSKGTGESRLRSQIAFFAPFLGKSVLEIGCASGELAELVKPLVERYDGVELAQTEAKLDRLYTVPHPVFDRRYDLVIMSHVLEHIEDVHAQIAGLPIGGSVFIEVPNRSGHPSLPLDDNVSHLHFFSATSLLRLLATHGLEVAAIETTARLDARYADSIRVVARKFTAPVARPLLTDVLKPLSPLVVWGAGSVAQELLANFLDPSLIEFFVDGNPAKCGTVCMGRPVRAPGELGSQTVLIASIDFADEIEADIKAISPGTRAIKIGDILDRL